MDTFFMYIGYIRVLGTPLRESKGLVEEQLSSKKREFAKIRGTPDVCAQPSRSWVNSRSNSNTHKNTTIINPNFPLTMAVDRPPSPKWVRLSLSSPCHAVIAATATFVNAIVTPNVAPIAAPNAAPNDAVPPTALTSSAPHPCLSLRPPAHLAPACLT